jgi:hypothetical protein
MTPLHNQCSHINEQREKPPSKEYAQVSEINCQTEGCHTTNNQCCRKKPINELLGYHGVMFRLTNIRQRVLRLIRSHGFYFAAEAKVCPAELAGGGVLV